MKFLIIAMTSLVIGTSTLGAQLWQSVGGGFHRNAYSLFADTTGGRLYAAGDFDSIGSAAACQIATWDGAQWKSPPNDSTCPYTDGYGVSAVVYEGELFFSGRVSNFQGIPGFQYLLQWDGIQWDTCGNPDTAPILEITNGQLFALGFIKRISGQKVGRIARWNGTDAWEVFCDSLPFEQGAGSTMASAFYNGEYVFAGNFTLPGNLNEIAAWDGTQWHPLGNGFVGDPWINRLQVFGGRLFAGGHFQESAGNASSYISAWDGSQWINPFPLVEFTTQVRDLKVIAGELYILGTHYTWNGASMQGPYQLARYDGQTFCSFGGMDILAHDIAGLNGRLYVTTSYYNHPDQYKGIAEWMGGNTVDICVSQPLQLDDDHESLPVPKVFPNPTEGFFKLHGLSQASRCNFSVYDITGREMMPEQKYTGGEVDVSMLPVGVYVVEIRMRDRVQRMKLVKQ